MKFGEHWSEDQRQLFRERPELISTQGGPPGLPRMGPMRRHPKGEALSATTARFVTVPAGRRSGKTERAKRHIVKQAIRARGTNPAFFVAAPTRDQAKRVFWDDLKAMFPRELIFGKPSESNLIIKLITGCEVHVVGMDVPARMEGKSWDGGVLDEIANMKPGAWEENVRPALSDRRGWCWLIGVPEGRNFYYDLDLKAKADTTGEWASFTWFSSEVLPAAEVESARRDMDPLMFQQEFEASFVNFVGRIYYTFNSDRDAKPLRQLYNPRAELILCFDFNVDPGVCVVAQDLAMPGRYAVDAAGLTMLDTPKLGTAVIGEVHIPENSNTPAVCRKIIQDWGKHAGRVTCFGDPAGGARHTSNVRGSDWDIIKQELRPTFGDRLNFEVPAAAPAERARVNAVNVRTYQGRLMIDPQRAPMTLRDFEGVRALKGGSGEIDKKHDPKLTHLSDALGYYIERRFPVRERVASATQLRTT